MRLLNTLRKIRACEGEAAAQVVFEHYLMLERNKVLDAAVEAGNKLVIERCGLNEEQESVYTVAIDEYQEAIQRLKEGK